MFKIVGATTDYVGKTRILSEVAHKVLGSDIPVYSQGAIGTIAAFVGKNVVEYTQAVQIALGEQKDFYPVYAPYTYYAARVLVGNKTLGKNDGLTMDMLNTSLVEYGVLPESPQLPPYTENVARSWGNGIFDEKLLPFHTQKIIKNYESLNTVDDIARAIYHGYPVAIYGEVMFTILPNDIGFHTVNPNTNASTCFTVIGFESHPKYGLSFLLLNSWGDAHGQIHTLADHKPLPKGLMRVAWNSINQYMKSYGGGAYAYSPYDNFVARADKLDEFLSKPSK